MRKFIIFFIIMVSIMTFVLTRSNKINEGNVVTDTELKEYRNSLIDDFEKYGYNFTEDEINEKVQKYKEMQISIAKSKSKGMDVKLALKTSLKVCTVLCLLLFILFNFKKAEYNVLLNNSLRSDKEDDDMGKLWYFFFDRRFFNIFNKWF